MTTRWSGRVGQTSPNPSRCATEIGKPPKEDVAKSEVHDHTEVNISTVYKSIIASIPGENEALL